MYDEDEDEAMTATWMMDPKPYPEIVYRQIGSVLELDVTVAHEKSLRLMVDMGPIALQ